MDLTSTGSGTDLTRIRDFSERCMHRAEESLRSLLGHSVRLTVGGISALSANALSALAEDAESASMVGLHFQITGQGSGCILILFPMPMVFRFLQILLGRSAEAPPLTEMERSAIQEVGNIMASSFLSELGDLLRRRLLHSAPEIRLENIPQLVRDALASLYALGSEVLVVQGLLEDAELKVQGRFFVVPEVAALEPIPRGVVGKREGSR